MKRRDPVEDHSLVEKRCELIDPQLTYMKGCLESSERPLPILNKIYCKTLCLQNYLLNEGHCQGLASACVHLDPRVVNKLMFDNCGLTGDLTSILLEGAASMRELKALTFKASTFNRESIDSIEPILARGMPNHLEELSIIDCRLSSTVLE